MFLENEMHLWYSFFVEIVNGFVLYFAKIALYSEPWQTFNMERFRKIVNGF